MPPMRSLLIANRGEIARRIMRTAQRMGVRTIAVYSDADAGAAHVREADSAVRIGPPAARESYLDAVRILNAARETDAAAVHPGYGFLSENADFAAAVKAAGLIWVGPPPEAIRAMGRKDAAKRLMAEAGVPVTPGYLGDDQAPERLAAEAAAIGWPVLIKAVAGGGGKGMRRVDRAEDFADALAGATREGAASFGDGRVLLEKYITRPRHIEVQIFGDAFGRVVHLFERDCSLQRRHQKVIEEAPAPGMDSATREALCAAAVTAGRAVGYQGAGTVEFIADGSEGLRADRIWFMEMNTRLQVEHPVTEAVTGLDLVEWQLRVAAGEALPPGEISLRGHAMEARLYAEDPARGFLPSTGRLDHFVMPTEARVDSGFEAGDAVSAFYDPMLAKVIVHADTREAAAAALARACGEVEVWPVRTNAAFLGRCAGNADFVRGDIDTSFIDRHLPELIAPPESPIAAGAVGALASRPRDPRSPWSANIGFRLNAETEHLARVFVDGEAIEAPFDLGGTSRPLHDREGNVIVFRDGAASVLSMQPPARAAAAGAADGAIRAPMPGRIVAVRAVAGQPAEKGGVLVVLEAMKMEHALTAPYSAAVAEVTVKEGDQVSEGAILVRLEPAA
ncbi:MAG: biotin carboxylase N-terminal domain-containing protein [Caulobacteraceae bacterium]